MKINEINRRLEEGEPFELILGKAEFCGFTFPISRYKSLIPRPETEEIVKMVLDLRPRGRIIDVGTGATGVIATTLALLLPENEILGVDIDEKSVEIARETAEKIKKDGGDVARPENVQFMQSDLLSNIPEEWREAEVIVANLPYVDRKWEWVSKDLAKWEAERALFTEDGGLKIIKRLIRQLSNAWYSEGRKIILEADPCQHERIIEFASQHGLEMVRQRGYQLMFISRKRPE